MPHPEFQKWLQAGEGIKQKLGIFVERAVQDWHILSDFHVFSITFRL